MFLSSAFAQLDSMYQLNIKGSVAVSNGDTTLLTLIPGYEVMFSDIFFLVPFVTDSTGNFEFTYEFQSGTEKEVIVSIVDLCTGELIKKKFKSTAGNVRADFFVCTDTDIPPNPNSCMAYFGYLPGSEPFSIQFHDLSYGNDVNSWSWSFGDGSTSDLQNPYHVYPDNGAYEVTLKIATTDDCDHFIEEYIKVTDACLCPDIWDPVCIATSSGGFLTFSNECEAICQGYSPNQFVSCVSDSLDCFVNINFIQNPQNDNFYKFIAELDFLGPFGPNMDVTYSWDFGDGTTSTQGPEVEHEFEDDGTYFVTLFVENENASCKTELKIVIGNDCHCDQIYDPVCVKSDNFEIIEFPNKCIAICEGYSPDDFVDCEPNDCYASIQLSTSPNADLLSVQFTAVVAAPTTPSNPTYFWDFGDGTSETTTSESIVHSYPENGIYIAKLKVDFGQNVICETKIEVNVPFNECICPPVYDPVCVETPNGIVTFGNICEAECQGYTMDNLVPCQNDSCFASIEVTQLSWNELKLHAYSFTPEPNNLEYTWEFGDGNVATGQTVVYEYEFEGEYIITLTVITEEGQFCTTMIKVTISDEFNPCVCNEIWDPVCVKTPNGIFTYGNLCKAECDGYTESDLVPCQDETCFTNILVNSTDDPMTLYFITDYPISILDSIDITWNFGDGTTATGPYFEHTYAEEGTYEVTVEITGFNIECKGGIKVTVPWDQGCACDLVYDPVCVETPAGIISYSNPCFAICDGYDTFVPCDTIEHCQANIWYNISNDNPLLVSFSAETLDATPTNNIIWNFGDGTTSTELSPTHTYAESGIYEVTVEINNGACIANGWSIICVHDGPWFPEDCQAIFDAYPINAAGTMYQFKDLSQNNIDAWEWNFGDGSTSTEQHPVHVFANEGFYDVTLAISTEDGCESKTFRTIAVGGDDPVDTSFVCQAIFGYFQTATTTFTVNFEDYSFGNTNTWLWEFGDGTYSTDPNPVHIYDEAGVYDVSLKITTDDCESKVTQKVVVLEDGVYPLDCQALFIFESSPNGDNQVKFLDLSYEDVLEWKWSFGDGETSTEQNPSHQYAESGIYTVQLKIKTASNCLSEFKMEIYVGDDIIVSDQCAAFFSGVINELEVSFKDLSLSTTPVYEWHWDFGDGKTSTLQNPVHNYETYGVYEVVLKITSQGCESKFLMTVDLYNGILEGRSQAADEATGNNDVTFVVENAIISPNPVVEAANLGFKSSINQELIINVISLTGEVVDQRQFDARAGNNQIQINTTNLSNGIYFIQIQSDKGVMSLKFVK